MRNNVSLNSQQSTTVKLTSTVSRAISTENSPDPGEYTPSLSFDDNRNSQYLALI